MDTVPPRDFFGIFDRISDTIDLKGCYSSDDVRRKLRRRMKTYDFARKRAEKKRTREHWLGEKHRLANLLHRKKGSEMDFADRSIYEASRNPHGIVNLTLEHGRAEAIRIRLRRMKKRLARRRSLRK